MGNQANNNQVNKKSVSEVVKEKDKNIRNEKYNQYVKQVTPKQNWILNSIKAFLIGGIICAIGQFFIEFYKSWGADKELSQSYTILTLVFLAILFTGIGLYQKLAKFGGAGTIVPITGFSNSVAAPAMEYKKEGQVFGIGCKIFIIAGPVILYGIFSSWVLGIIYYILKLLKVV